MRELEWFLWEKGRKCVCVTQVRAQEKGLTDLSRLSD